MPLRRPDGVTPRARASFTIFRRPMFRSPRSIPPAKPSESGPSDLGLRGRRFCHGARYRLFSLQRIEDTAGWQYLLQVPAISGNRTKTREGSALPSYAPTMPRHFIFDPFCVSKVGLRIRHCVLTFNNHPNEVILLLLMCIERLLQAWPCLIVLERR